MDRIHRLNQKRKVNVLRFVMKDSIEERIIKVQERKSLQAKGALQKLKVSFPPRCLVRATTVYVHTSLLPSFVGR